ncbi:MAG: VCBS repeat-containing protein [Candidatus Hydrogenedentota bacterium]
MRKFQLISTAICEICLLAICAEVFAAEEAGTTWKRHVIDDTSDGADGVRLADVNEDGLLDIATGWEEGNTIKAYLNPGPAEAKSPWPSVVVGRVRSPEDAVFADVDGNGVMDVVSACEGSERTVFVHWAPDEPSAYLDASQWKTEAIPASRDRTQWMFVAPLPDPQGGPPRLFAGAKNEGAAVGVFEPGSDPRNLETWTWKPIYPVGWIMSLMWADIDGDGLVDLLLTDRKGRHRGCHWLRNPGDSGDWEYVTAGLRDHEVMFLGTDDLDGDGARDIVVATKGGPIMRLEKQPGDGWNETAIPMPENTGTGKGIGLGDMNGNGRMDIVFTCEHAENKRGIMYLAQQPDGTWVPHDIGGLKGIKYDRIELIDLDGDGDLDVLTCEERTGLGVIWYENPLK